MERQGISPEVIEAVSEKVHDSWMEAKRRAGVTSRRLDTTGEELVRPYKELSEPAKDLDRGSVRATLEGLDAAGFVVVTREEWDGAVATAAER